MQLFCCSLVCIRLTHLDKMLEHSYWALALALFGQMPLTGRHSRCCNDDGNKSNAAQRLQLEEIEHVRHYPFVALLAARSEMAFDVHSFDNKLQISIPERITDNNSTTMTRGVSVRK